MRSGRPKCLNRVAKIIINKPMGKRWQSVRKLSRKLTCEGYKTSKSTVHRHLSNSLGATPYKRPKIPRITDRIKENRLPFAQARVEWTIDDWKRVLWSDESPFEIFSTLNRQNDRVWVINSNSVQPIVKMNSQKKS